MKAEQIERSLYFSVCSTTLLRNTLLVWSHTYRPQPCHYRGIKCGYRPMRPENSQICIISKSNLIKRARILSYQNSQWHASFWSFLSLQPVNSSKPLQRVLLVSRSPILCILYPVLLHLEEESGKAGGRPNRSRRQWRQWNAMSTRRFAVTSDLFRDVNWERDRAWRQDASRRYNSHTTDKEAETTEQSNYKTVQKGRARSMPIGAHGAC